jgi:hypothetical protein
MNEGLFEPRVMFFGLTNSPTTFQAMMNAIFVQELREGWLTIYMDDILVHTQERLPLPSTTRSPSARQTQNARFIPQIREMPIRTEKSGIPRSGLGERDCANGPS